MRIRLINPPFGTTRLPSLALTQLKSRLAQRFGQRVDVEVLYFNHELARFLGVELYEAIATSIAIYHTGFGDWFFRQLAFPGEPDNRDAYLRRYYRRDSRERALVERALERRGELEPFFAELIARQRLDRADLAGCTSTFSQTVASLAILRQLKAANVSTALGGAGCEGPTGRELARKIPWLDYVFSGPALVSLPALVQARLDGVTAHIPGVLGKGQLSGSTGEELPISEPIELDFRDHLDSFARLNHGEAGLLFETSRGCWWGALHHCTFCGLNGETMAHREMPPEQALAQLHSLFARHPEVSWFQAVDNILPYRYLETVLPRLKPPPGAVVYYEIKCNLDEEDVKLLRRSGVSILQPGIEALNTSVLKLMNKGLTAFQNLRFLGWCQTHGVFPNWNFLIGFPGEAEEVYPKYLRDLPLLHHLPPPEDVSTVRFDRFSPYHAQAADYGLDLQPFDFYRFIYPFDDASLTNLAYHFVHRDPGFYVPVGRWQRLLSAEVQRWRARWSGSDGLIRAQLHFVSANEILDSRDGRERILRLDPAERAALAALASPRSDVAIPASLVENRLLFEESGRFLSLVLAGAPTPMPALSWFADHA